MLKIVVGETFTCLTKSKSYTHDIVWALVETLSMFDSINVINENSMVLLCTCRL